MNKREVLQSISFGHRIAEEEASDLESYFVETNQWIQIYHGDVDIVYGPKGSGKSAIYSLLLKRDAALFDRGILIVAAENPRGAPAFKDLIADPPASEEEYRNLWKIYFLSLIGGLFREFGIPKDLAKKVTDPLEEAGLLPREYSLRGLLRSGLDYVRSRMQAESLEGGLEVDPTTGLPKGLTGKITFREPNSAQRDSGLISADSLLDAANVALENSDFQIWLVLDRLDVAFAESEELESTALRALFRVYRDFTEYNRISLKIFLRTDIWRRITKQGFREASHITRNVTLVWNKETLLNLVIRRCLTNNALRTFFGVDEANVLQNAEEQEKLFYRMFPKQVNVGRNKPITFDWLLSRTRDGSGETAPRELIHLLSSARDVQLRRFEVGYPPPTDETLFERTTLREALPDVSEFRLLQTLFAENPDMREWLQKLRNEKTQQSPETLAEIWRIDLDSTLKLATSLVEIGFFERRGSNEEPIFWVPFLYRDALNMVQGSAVPGLEDPDQQELDLFG